MKKVEVLAPAGDFDSFLSALNNGADAIYLGLTNFNARGNIENFTVENIKEIVRKAHLFGVKIYLTLNTLVLDDEIEDVIKLVRKCLEAKVDAFIVQDVGLAHLLSSTFKGIELHASTQMGLQNIEGVDFVSKLGFSRVVLARETPINEIKNIKENCDLDIEYFVQGALCVGFSGNCYLCSLLAGASGNRGKCKQFCRLPYSLNNQEKEIKKGYLLSTKDFCNLSYLKELTESGVTSLKIEGRARRPAYVGGAVSIYRKAVDNNFKFNEKDMVKLKKLFNRGEFITGYFKNEKIIYPQAQNHIGIQIGEVFKVNYGKKFNEVLIKSCHQIQKGDSLKFFDKEKEVASINVQDVKEKGGNLFLITTTTDIKIKNKVNLIVDSLLEKEILTNKRKINLTARIQAKIGQKATLFMCADKVSVSVEGEEVLEESKNQPLTKEECFKQLSKGGEDFLLYNLECDIDNVFIRKASLNDLRRRCLEKLQEKIIKNNEKNIKIIEKTLNLDDNNIKINNKNIYIYNDLKKLNNEYNFNDYFIYSPEYYNEIDILDFCNKNKEKTIYLEMPVISTRADINLFKKIFNNCTNLGVYATNYYCFSFASPEKTIISPEMNVFNSYAIDFYLKNGFNKIVLSKELFDFDKINTQNAEIFKLSQVNQKYMYFKHCPIKEHVGGDCSSCKYKVNLEYRLGDRFFTLKRKKAVNCQFYLVDKKQSNYQNNRKFGNVIEKIV